MELAQAIEAALGDAGRMERLFGSWALKALPRVLREGELPERIVQGRYGGGQGILVATNQRLLFLVKGLVGMRTTEFPYEQITSVEQETGLAMGGITITVAGNAEVIDQILRERVQPLVDHIRQKIAQPRAPQVAATGDIAEQLERLVRLRDAGELTQEQYEAAKARLLGG